MASSPKNKALGQWVAALGVGLATLVAAGAARADEATLTIGPVDPPRDPPPVRSAPVVVDDGPPGPELRRSPFRLALGPAGITTGKGLGLGVGLGADFGTGSVGGRLGAVWVRGEGTRADGTPTATGDALGQYTGEITLDLHKRGPLHPVLGLGAGILHVSRSDASGFAGVGTGRLGLEVALGLDDADVRLGGGVTGGLVGPIDGDVKDLRAYALLGVQLAVGF